MTRPRLTPLQRDLLAWAGGGRRDLPWRRTRDPWAVLVSELMLQQTQVPRVVPKYRAFMAKLPTPLTCAEAGVGEVMRAWAGLGYNRRAVNLHRLAVEVVERHDGRLPDDLDALLQLPGVGPYTARAVLVFAFGHDIGLIDTTAGRFVARALAGRSLSRREAQEVADAAVPTGFGWDWGQAVFDLSALVCTRRSPECDRCPVSAHCSWYASGRPEPDPAATTAGASGRQSTFNGSDRQGRGRLVDALLQGPVELGEVAAVVGWPDDPPRADRVAVSLVSDGLAVRDGDVLRLP